uniref:Uncharacterized protein n=1 Tax=Chenopodium quinoa TaxID=63459 RepID=A0A803KWT2_CHEQI
MSIVDGQIPSPMSFSTTIVVDSDSNGHLPMPNLIEKSRRWSTLFLAYKTLGVVFGGLVTSPLYVYPSMSLKSPTEEDYLGIYCIMFWSLSLIGVIKYACITLKADDQGEGGTFALYSLLSRHMRIGFLSAKDGDSSGVTDSRLYEGQEKQSKLGKIFKESMVARRVLLFISILGMCMLIGDGILTPAISVLSAIQGIRAPFPKVTKIPVDIIFCVVELFYITTLAAAVEVLSAAIIILLFLLQKFGTSRVSFLFSPVMGAEALFADLGHFSRRSIQVVDLFVNSVGWDSWDNVTTNFKQSECGCQYGHAYNYHTSDSSHDCNLENLTNISIPFLLDIIPMESVYVSAVLIKIPEGGWIPFAISIILALIMFGWYFGRERKIGYELTHKIDVDRLQELLSDPGVHRVPGICFFYSNIQDGLTPVLGHYIKNVKSLHKVTIFTTLKYLLVPKVAPHERIIITKFGLKGIYGCVIQYGYADSLHLEGGNLVNQVTTCLQHYITHCSGPLSADQASIQDELSSLEEALNVDVVHVLGKTRFHLGQNCSWFDRIMLAFYEVMHSNCRSSLPTLELPLPQRMEVGMLYEALNQGT